MSIGRPFLAVLALGWTVQPRPLRAGLGRRLISNLKLGTPDGEEAEPWNSSED